MKIMTKRISFAAIALAAVAAIAWLAMRPPTVECIVLENNMLQNAFSEIAEVVPVSETSLYTKIGGKLLEVNAVAGAAAAKGELLFVFDGKDLENEEAGILAEIAILDSQINSQITSLEMQKNSLKSEQAGIQIKIEQTILEEKRQQADVDSVGQLFDIGAVPAQNLADAQAAYALTVKNRELLDNQLELIAAQLSQAEAEIRGFHGWQATEGEAGAEGRQQLLAQKDALLAQLNAQREKRGEIEVTAPKEGVIRDAPLKEGQIVPPGTKLCSIYQPDQYRIDCYILVENTAGVHMGDEVEVTLRLRDGDQKVPGHILRKAHEAEDRVSKVGLSEKRVKIEVAVKEGDWAAFGPYWPVEVRFVTAQAENCLVVPKTALFKEGEDVWKVWAVRDGRAVALTVERGIQTPSQVEIRGGIGQGDIIVKNAKAGNILEGESVRAII